MSLEENHKKIDDKYVHYAVKLKNSLALKKDSKILDELGVEIDDVHGCKFCIRGFPYVVQQILKFFLNPHICSNMIMINLLALIYK